MGKSKQKQKAHLSKKQKWRAKKYGKKSIVSQKTNWKLHNYQKGNKMIKKLYSIYDKKAQSTLQVFELPNDLVAIRDFSQICTNKESQIAKFAEDYSLMCLGELNTETGVIASDVRVVAQAKDYVSE